MAPKFNTTMFWIMFMVNIIVTVLVIVAMILGINWMYKNL